MGEFNARYGKGTPTKDHGNHLILRGGNSVQQENNAIINNMVDRILLNETKK